MGATLLLLAFLMMLAVTTLYHGHLEAFAALAILFGMSVTLRIFSKTPRKKPESTDKFVVDVTQRRTGTLYRMGLYLVRLYPISALFGYEMQRVEKKTPYTGRTVNAKRFTVQTGIVTVLCIISLGIVIPIAATQLEMPSLYLLMPAPLLIPLAAPLLLDVIISERRTKSASEFLAFVTYAGIMHTVQKTMFWTMQSVCSSAMFCQLSDDSQIVLRYAKGGGEEEGYSIVLMARYHPNRMLREFLEKYVSYIPTNATRLANYVEAVREESLQGTIQKIASYADSANMIFFMGTMTVSILPIMLTVMAFLPSSGFDGASFIGVMFVLPLAFVIFPVFLSAGSVFLQSAKRLSRVSAVAGAASFVLLHIMLPEHLLVSASISVAVFSGINWGANARADWDALHADRELPDMLDYIAEQKKSNSDMMQIFSEYAALPNTAGAIREILYSISSEILQRQSGEAFLGRKFPSRTVQFVFFMLHAIYEHGGGTYETVVSMAHSMRRIAELKEAFAASSRLSVGIAVLSPAVFMFCVMMTSFMTFGVSGDDTLPTAMTVRSDDVAGIVESLKPVSLIIAVAGGLGVSRAVCYSFLQTQYLFLATITSTACLLLWDTLFDALQGLV